MLHLADAFGFTDRKENDTEPFALDCLTKTLLDSSDDRLQFTPNEIAATVRITANGIFSVFRRILEPSTTLSVQQRAIAIVLPHSIAETFVFLAVAGLSMIACPMYSVLSTQEYKYAFQDMKIELLIVSGAHGNPLAERAARELGIPTAWFSWKFSDNGELPIPIVGDQGAPHEAVTMLDDLSINPKEFEVCLKIHTAGTTARPKTVSLTHRNVVLSLANIQKTYSWAGYTGEDGLNSEDYDIGYCVVPLNHLHGLIASCLAPLSCQSRVIIGKPEFDPATFWKDIVKYKVTWTTIVPDMLMKLLASRDATYPNNEEHQLRFIRVTGSPLDSAAAAEAEQKFNTTIVESYALTEASHQICSNGYTVNERKFGSVGKPTGTEVAILRSGTTTVAAIGEAGEIWIRGHTVIDKYDDNEDGQMDSDFLMHNDIQWEPGNREAPAFFSSSFDLSPGLSRRFSSVGKTSPSHLLQSISQITMSPAQFTATDELLPPTPGIKDRAIACRGLARIASALTPYTENEFPQRTETMLSPLQLQISWLRTGDIGLFDSEYRLSIIGRSNDIINRGGVKVAPTEIEELYKSFKEVENAAAFGVKTSTSEQVIFVALVMREGMALTDELMNVYNLRAKENLAKFKVPQEVHQVKALPVDVDGRILRSTLSEIFSQ